MANLIVFGVAFAAIYFLMIRPQQQRQREAAALMAGLEPGDEVVLSSGIHGFLTEVEAAVVWVEVAEGTELKVTKSSVISKVTEPETDES